MNHYPNGNTQETGPEYSRGYQHQPYPQPSQQPIYPPGQYPQPVYPPPQPMPPQYPPQSQMGYPYPPQPMMMPVYPQPMMAPQTNVNVNIGYQRPQQISMLVRMIYFCFVGWWLGLFCLGVALSLCCTIIGLPLGLMILNRLGAIMTLSSR